MHVHYQHNTQHSCQVKLTLPRTTTTGLKGETTTEEKNLTQPPSSNRRARAASYQNVHHGSAGGSQLVLQSSTLLKAWTHACHPPTGCGPLLHKHTHTHTDTMELQGCTRTYTHRGRKRRVFILNALDLSALFSTFVLKDMLSTLWLHVYVWYI